jgi:hypothetical protein
MKRLVSLLLGLVLTTPAFAQERPTPAAATPATASVHYAASAQRLPDGQFRAEVRRGNGGSEEIAWSSAPHATQPEALKEACKMIEAVYAPGTPCPAVANAAAKKTPALGTESKPLAKTAAGGAAKAKVGVVSPVSGYEVRGCAFYALVEGRVVQRCPSEGAPGTKPFWYNEDAFEGGYGGWGR